jgi:hypothetical protein
LPNEKTRGIGQRLGLELTSSGAFILVITSPAWYDFLSTTYDNHQSLSPSSLLCLVSLGRRHDDDARLGF